MRFFAYAQNDIIEAQRQRFFAGFRITMWIFAGGFNIITSS